MEDEQIINLYWERDEAAIAESSQKYGTYCHAIADGILHSAEDAEECVNDTWLRAWNAIPPERPSALRFFFAKITRNLSLSRWRKHHADKRGGGRMPLILDELRECTDHTADVESQADYHAMQESLHRFLHSLPDRELRLFLGRYFYAKELSELAGISGISVKNVSVILYRVRKRLHDHFIKEGFGDEI